MRFPHPLTLLVGCVLVAALASHVLPPGEYDRRDPSVAPLLQKMLAPHGYRVVAATSPGAAVSEARDLKPSAILLDVLMPEHSGHDVLRELKADPATKEIPVLVISVVDAAEIPDLADGHLNKPVQSAPLLQLLERHAAITTRQP